MTKRIPDCPKKPEPAGKKSREFKIELIAPMFGGGVKAGEPDLSLPIRGTSIRGHLQFWWRATRGASCASRTELFARHIDVWGTTERSSPVEVKVHDVQCDRVLPCANYTPRANGTLQLNWMNPFRGTDLPYVLFPFQGQLTRDRRNVEEGPANFINKASFILLIRFPERLRQEVEIAVSAWVNFGGLGARTRRGCGSLYCEQFAPESVSQLSSLLKTFCPQVGTVREWPTMPESILVYPDVGDPFVAWNRVVGQFKYFRQGEGFARNPNQGRSRYPEPETIRRITDRRSEKHEPWENMPDGFPRAELGLPIVFHFKDENKGEPRKTMLIPYVNDVALERMASPLILKPLALKNRKAVSLILRLTTGGVQQVELKDTDNGKCLTPRHAVPVQDKSLAVSGSPLHGLTTSGSALEAFMNLAKKQKGFKEYML